MPRPSRRSGPRCHACWARPLAIHCFTVIALTFVLAASAEAKHTVTATTGPTAPPADFFPIAVYRQSTATYDVWKSRGINTVVDMYDNPVWMEQFNQAAVAHQFWMIRNPRQNVAADINQPYLLAWTHPDEPDVNNISPAALQKEYRIWKRADPSRPIIANFAASTAIYQLDSLTDSVYQQYLKAADWVSSDVYPLSAWGEPDWIDNNAKPNPKDKWYHTGVTWNEGNGVDKLRELSGGKRQFAYVETSFQNLSWPEPKKARAPTPDEFRGEVWDSIIHGARGIIYFPFTFPNKPDGTPKLVAREMTRVDSLITQLAPAITNTPDDAPNRMTLSGGLEGAWRTYNGSTYFFVLNFSHQSENNVSVALGDQLNGQSLVQVFNESRDLSVSPDGSITDTFAPYALHVYVTANLAAPAVLSSVPEPQGIVIFLFFLALHLLHRRSRSHRPRAV